MEGRVKYLKLENERSITNAFLNSVFARTKDPKKLYDKLIKSMNTSQKSNKINFNDADAVLAELAKLGGNIND